MDKESLEAKLRAIQELKAEKYIGTQEAWRYLKEIENLSNYSGSIAKKHREIFFNTLDLCYRIERMLHDQVDNRLERRREIITDFITHHNFNSYSEIVDFFNCYGPTSALGVIFSNPEIEEFGISAMEVFSCLLSKKDSIEIRKKKSRIYNFLKRSLFSEKNFIERYLREGRK